MRDELCIGDLVYRYDRHEGMPELDRVGVVVGTYGSSCRVRWQTNSPGSRYLFDESELMGVNEWQEYLREEEICEAELEEMALEAQAMKDV